MSRKIHCGRLELNKDGNVKVLGPKAHGGTVYCEINRMNVSFNEIHYRLRELFSIDPSNRNTTLYDYHLKKLDVKQYKHFSDYIDKKGLNFRGTVLYLCTWKGNRPTLQVTQPKQPLIQVPTVQQPIKTSQDVKSVLINRICENLRISSLSDYSFEKSIHDLVDYVQNLLTQYSHETILIQLFQHVCTVQDLSSTILDRSKQEIQSSDQQQKQIYIDTIEKIIAIFKSVKVLIESNTTKFQHVDEQSMIIKSFNQFKKNLIELHNQLVEKTNENEQISSTCHHSEKVSEQNNEENPSLFKDVLKSFDHLSDVLQHLRNSSFSFFVRSLATKIETCQSSIDLSNYESIRDVQMQITSIETCLIDKRNDEHCRAQRIYRELETSFDETLRLMKDLLKSLQYYQDLIDKNKRPRTTNWSSSPRQESFHSASSEASHSTVDDGVLEIIANNSF